VEGEDENPAELETEVEEEEEKEVKKGDGEAAAPDEDDTEVDDVLARSGRGGRLVLSASVLAEKGAALSVLEAMFSSSALSRAGAVEEEVNGKDKESEGDDDNREDEEDAAAERNCVADGFGFGAKKLETLLCDRENLGCRRAAIEGAHTARSSLTLTVG